jgi:hypothetical protein
MGCFSFSDWLLLLIFGSLLGSVIFHRYLGGQQLREAVAAKRQEERRNGAAKNGAPD